MTKEEKPLGPMSIMHNSIVDFVLTHQGRTDVFNLYNEWAAQPHEGFTLNLEYTLAALRAFRVNVHYNTLRELQLIQSIENSHKPKIVPNRRPVKQKKE